MKDEILFIVSKLKSVKIATSQIEKDLGFSNGLLSKGMLSDDKFARLLAYYQKHEQGNEEIVYRIYKLINPITNDIFYVGATRQPLDKRLNAHISESGSGSIKQGHQKPSKKQTEISAIVSEGKIPLIEAIEEIKNTSLLKCYELSLIAEQKWVSTLLSEGNKLLNRPSVISKLRQQRFITTANQTEITISSPKNEYKIEVAPWIKEIEDYCSNAGILPQDLINLHKNGIKPPTPPKQGKETKFHDFTQDKSYGKPYSPFDNPTFRSKMKMGEKK